MTSSHRPPSCDLLTPVLKECPFCEGEADWSDFNKIVICEREGCRVFGPYIDPLGHKWNSIPRKHEVAELLRLVDEVAQWDWKLINTSAFPEDGKQMCEDLDKLEVYADRMRKEWRL